MSSSGYVRKVLRGVVLAEYSIYLLIRHAAARPTLLHVPRSLAGARLCSIQR